MEKPASSEMRPALLEADQPLDLLVEGMLGVGASIDWVCRNSEGAVVLVQWAPAGESLVAWAHLTAQLRWVEPRLADWQTLAPERDLDASLAPTAFLVSPEFCPRTRELAGLPDSPISLARWVRLDERGWLLPESVPSTPASTSRPQVAGPPGNARAKTSGRSVVSRPGSHFRTRLRDEDL